jgi:hypothetical protein
MKLIPRYQPARRSSKPGSPTSGSKADRQGWVLGVETGGVVRLGGMVEVWWGERFSLGWGEGDGLNASLKFRCGPVSRLQHAAFTF